MTLPKQPTRFCREKEILGILVDFSRKQKEFVYGVRDFLRVVCPLSSCTQEGSRQQGVSSRCNSLFISEKNISGSRATLPGETRT